MFFVKRVTPPDSSAKNVYAENLHPPYSIHNPEWTTVAALEFIEENKDGPLLPSSVQHPAARAGSVLAQFHGSPADHGRARSREPPRGHDNPCRASQDHPRKGLRSREQCGGRSMDRRFASVDCLVMGRRSFEKVLSSGVDWPYGERPVVVLSRSGVPRERGLQSAGGNRLGTALVQTEVRAPAGMNAPPRQIRTSSQALRIRPPFFGTTVLLFLF